jgi:subtilisin family serine protease
MPTKGRHTDMSTSDGTLDPIHGLQDGVDDHGTRRGGSAGRYFWYRPNEILVAAEDVEKVVDALGHDNRSTEFAATARGMQRQVKRETTAPFGVAVFGLEREDGEVEDVLARLTAADINCDFNYVTAPTPMRSHAVSYAEPAAVAAIPPALDPKGEPNIVVGVLDTGRPHYDTSFVDYYRTRFAPATGDQATSPLTALDSRFVAAAGLASGNEPHDDRDTMVTSFGRLAHPHAGHGMFVASIIARHAPAANLLAETTMSGDSIGDLYDMLVDLEHAADSGCRILNMSMGFPARDGADGQFTCPPLLDRALRRLAERNVKLVASAGNDGSQRPSWPAAHETVAAVAAVDADVGPTEWSNFGSWVDACALGDEVVSDYVYADWDHPDGSARRFSGAATWSGTSFAAPLVAALLATAYSKALAASATDQEPSVEDVWQELVGKAWTDMIGIAEPDESTRQKHPYGPRLDRPR